MHAFAKRLMMAALAAGGASQAWAADLPEPVIEPAPPPVVYQDDSFGGWYIRGDIDYHASEFGEAEYITYGPSHNNGTLDGDIDESWSAGAGVGYQVTNYLRADLTVDYLADADFSGSTTGYCGAVVCTSSDETSYSAWLLLANAYAEFGTYYGFTPYIGAGIGGAHVEWDELHNTIGPDTTTHEGGKEWRFAYAVMAGTSYCLTKNLDLDVGYRYAHIEGGDMFGYANGGGPGWDDGIDVHEVRGGLRYQFGNGRTSCDEPEPVAYVPPAEPVYK